MVELSLELSDREIVDRLNMLTGGKCAVRVITRRGRGAFGEKPQARIAFGCRKIVEDLARYGIGPRKSLTAVFAGGIETNRHAWRGVIDGDGSIFHRVLRPGGVPHPFISLVGSLALLEQFATYVAALSPGYSGTPRPAGKNKPHYHIVTSGRHAQRLAANLYEGATIALTRKAIRAAEVMKWVCRSGRT